MIDTKNEFVYEGKIWTLTGRVAYRNIYHKRKVNEIVGRHRIVEISPDGIASGDPEFLKWVDPRELYFVEDHKSIDIMSIREENDKVTDEQND